MSFGAVLNQTFAPSGFGWGDRISVIKAQSPDETYETYCGRLDSFLNAMPNNTAALVNAYPPEIYGRSSTTVSILYKASEYYAELQNVGTAEETLYGWRIVKNNGKWAPFEWVNPPLKIGVEYRTTERYNTKPVYVKLLDLGAMPNTTAAVVPHGIENVADMLQAYGTTSNYRKSIPTENFTGSQGYVRLVADGTNVVIQTGGNYSSGHAYVILKYTKKTD